MVEYIQDQKDLAEDGGEDGYNSLIGNYWNETAKKAVGLAFSAISMLGSAGCYTNHGIKPPEPDFSERTPVTQDQEEETFSQYMRSLKRDVRLAEEEPLYDEEEKFYRYLEFLERAAGADIHKEELDIIPNSPIKALGDTDPLIALSLPEEDGIYWHHQYIVGNEGQLIEKITHEVGHSLDTELSSIEWLLSNRERVRTESAADAFEHYIGLELIAKAEPTGKDLLMELYNINYGKSVEITDTDKAKKLENSENIEDILETDLYVAGNGLAAMLMNKEESVGETWEYLATHDSEEVYGRIKKIIEEEGGFQKATEKGLDLIRKEIKETISNQAQKEIIIKYNITDGEKK